MATLIVTYSHINGRNTFNPPVAQGAGVRTETLTIPATGTLTAATEQVVELLADADCWVAIGAAPDAGVATDGTAAARKLTAGVPYAFSVAEGDKVAVEAA